MQYSIIELSVAFAMLGAVVLLVLGWQQFVKVNMIRRMAGMLAAVGLDPALATDPNLPRVMGEARQRCRHCPSEGVCERWLAGELSRENDFCPNAGVFAVLKRL